MSEELPLPSDSVSTFNNIFLGNGTSSSPSLNFTSETSLGLYRKSSSLLSLVAGGSDIFTIGSTRSTAIKPLSLSDQAATVNPSINTEGFLYKKANSNSLWWNVQGVGEVDLTNTGSITYPLLANPAGDATSPAYAFSTSTSTGTFSPVADTLAFTTNGSERVRYTATGDVGVGTTTPEVIYSGFQPNNLPLIYASTSNVFNILNADTAPQFLSISGDSTAGPAQVSTALTMVDRGGVLNERIISMTCGSNGSKLVYKLSNVDDSGSTVFDNIVFNLNSGTSLTIGNAKEALKINSTVGAFIPPVMTATEASAITTPAEGSIIYVSSTDATFTSVGIWSYENSTWNTIGSDNLGNHTATQALQLTAGSASAPSLTFVGDTNTGIYHSAADELAMVTGGTQRLTVNASGQTVLEYNSGSTQLGFKRSDGLTAGSMYFATTNYLYIANSEVGQGIVLQTNNTTGAGGIQFNDTLNGQWFYSNSGLTSIASTDVDLTRCRADPGSASLPSWSFKADTDTGMYNSAVNEIAFATGGAKKCSITSSGSVVVEYVSGGAQYGFKRSDGFTAATMYFDSLNYLYISNISGNRGLILQTNTTSGTNGIQFNDLNGPTTWFYSNIGTTSISSTTTEMQTARLAAGSATVPSLSFIADTDTGIYNGAANELSFAIGGVESYLFDSTSLSIKTTGTLTNPNLILGGGSLRGGFYVTDDTKDSIIHIFSDQGIGFFDIITFTLNQIVPASSSVTDLGNTSFPFSGVYAVSFNTVSDERKKNLTNLGIGPDLIMRLNPLSFTWKEVKKDKRLHTGFSAQQTMEQLNILGITDQSLVQYDSESDSYTMAYSELIAPLVATVQQQNKQIQDLQTQINELKNKINTLI